MLTTHLVLLVWSLSLYYQRGFVDFWWIITEVLRKCSSPFPSHTDICWQLGRHLYYILSDFISHCSSCCSITHWKALNATISCCYLPYLIWDSPLKEECKGNSCHRVMKQHHHHHDSCLSTLTFSKRFFRSYFFMPYKKRCRSLFRIFSF